MYIPRLKSLTAPARINRTIYILGFMIFCALHLHAQDLPPEALRHIKEASVYIEVTHSFPFESKELKSAGSGFFISKTGYLITCNHVVEPFITSSSYSYPSIITGIRVISNSGTEKYRKYNAIVINVDKQNDLALLYVDDTAVHAFLDIDTSRQLVESSPVWAFGFPLGSEFSVIQRGPEITVTKGFITALRHDDLGDLEKIQLDAVVKSGNSGSPLINAEGKAIGVVNIAMGDSRFNFAIPAHDIQSLLNGVRIGDKAPGISSFSVVSDPPGAMVIVDSKVRGITPTKTLEAGFGFHSVCAAKEGYDLWRGNGLYKDNEQIHAILVPQRRLPVKVTGRKDASAAAPLKYEAINTLYSEYFDNEARFKTWKQNTGGEGEHTWFIENNSLNQYESDNLLHAISLGDTTWKDYLMTARVRITDKHDDSRAGLIFNETGDGFYVFRIHKESDKAQLTYHSNHPFGWFVIAERNLDEAITDDWFRLSTVSAGGMVSCWFNSTCLFTTRAKYSDKGNIGFYSVESKASFDSLTVKSVRPADTKSKSGAEQEELISFWFSDYFDPASFWWNYYTGDKYNPDPWYSTDGGTAQFITDEKTRTAEFTRYLLSDLDLNLLMTFDDAVTESAFEFFFRKTANSCLVLRFVSKDKCVELITAEGDEKEVLKKVPLPEEFFGYPVLFHLILSGKKLVLENSGKILMEFKTLPEATGTFGFSTTKLRLVLHQMNVASVREDKL